MVLEQISGKDLKSFFNQRIYSAGHPEVSIELLQNKNSIKITHLQPNFFEFPLEIKFVFDIYKDKKDTILPLMSKLPKKTYFKFQKILINYKKN